MIIVSIASHPGRIKNVYTVLQNIIHGTVVPDKIVINLAKNDFQDNIHTCYSLYELAYEIHTFPQELYDLVKEYNKLIEIHWYDDASIKSWKRYYYVSKYYVNDTIITIDDDRIYSKEFVECMIKSYECYGCKYPVTTSFDIAEGSFRLSAFAQVYTPSMLGFFSSNLFTNEVMHMFPDDIFVSMAFEYYGYLKMPVIGKNFLFQDLSYNEMNSLYANDTYTDVNVFNTLMNDTIIQMNKFNEITNNIDKNNMDKHSWNFNVFYYAYRNIKNFLNNDFNCLNKYEKMIYDVFNQYINEHLGECIWYKTLEDRLSNIKL